MNKGFKIQSTAPGKSSPATQPHSEASLLRPNRNMSVWACNTAMRPGRYSPKTIRPDQHGHASRACPRHALARLSAVGACVQHVHGVATRGSPTRD
jgi:hypothetical protein